MHAAAASVLLPVAAKPGLAALADLSSHWDYVFFDERFEVVRRNQVSGLALGDEMVRRACARGDDRRAAGHRFERHEAEAFPTLRPDDNCHAPHPEPDFRRRQFAEKLDSSGQTRRLNPGF